MRFTMSAWSRPAAAPMTPAGFPERRRIKGRMLGRVDVHETMDAAERAWAELENLSPGAAYQTRRWLGPWMETMGQACGAEPMLVVAYARDRSLMAFLPLGVVGHEKLRIAGFLGGRDSNANLGLFRPGAAFSKPDLESMFRAAAAKSRRRPDAFVLANQPETWAGHSNPLLVFPRQPSPSFGHSTRLSPDFQMYLETKLSSDARKKFRKKRSRLDREIGPVGHVVAADPAEARRVIEAFFEQKIARFKLLGIESEFEHPASRRFIERASLDGLSNGRPVVELHALIAGDRIVATYGGAHHRGRFHAMFNSFDMSTEIARSSPGDLLLLSILEQMSARGVETLDLGIGEARYKDAWCEIEDPLFDTIIPVSAKGRAFALGEATRLQVKRQVKQNPWLWSITQRLRAGRA